VSPDLALRRRASELREVMDDPACDPVRLERTYAQFAVLNQLLGHWGEAWRQVLEPVARRAAADGRTVRLLDIGCGGGDLARRLAGWAARDGLPLDIVAVDPDPRALAYARRRATPPNVRYRPRDVRDLAAEGARFDLVVSNHVLHHLAEDELRELLDASARLARGAALHNDLRRSPWAIPAFAAFSLPFRRSFVREDGFRSIRRAFTPAELRALAPPGWRVRPVGRFRQWLLHGAEPP
jgi:2-polyprenyl-3-methyl-5-hydroxy-6-metoxy-1,4-benzoquinol methylase